MAALHIPASPRGDHPMGPGFIFSFQPTFTQGFLLGQFSILALLAVVLKYLFLDTDSERSSTKVAERASPMSQPSRPSTYINENSVDIDSESTEWLNDLLLQVTDIYRSKLKDDLQGIEGDEVLRQRVESFVNLMRPSGILDRIQVHSVNLGVSAPRLFNARSKPVEGLGSFEHNEFDMVYKDDFSISLSTAYLFNYPTIGFARLPVSVTISLSVFSCCVVITPPSHSSPVPALTITMLPNFTLDLIDNQLRRALIQWGKFKILLPGLANIEIVKGPEGVFNPH
ncbi:maintenance of mitochondrial morphology protein 1 [Russula earlei]|uniref:Maintenance of mitochondrial morphology protein 1 n=1 Tax=Russula earlei TaxID=71964 RepID=A0ACC0UPY5_9AGAM|nr:maintenance of mitochondrial morphology protein 1 [Russula earlei]